MTSLRAVLCLALPITVALSFTGCASASSSSGDLDTRAGCALVSASSTMAGSQVVMDVTATACHDPDGHPRSVDAAADRVAEVVWQSLRLPVDSVHVRVLGSAGAPDGAAVIFARENLEARFGPGPPGVVWPVRQHGVGDSLWLLLPVAYVVAGLGMVCVARATTRAGVVVFLFRR
ncbi:hypothetical protein I4I84_06460 [Pseudonocardia sp. KRD-182]|uniref:hypothetical protein n=1 Tax=Pseudonocardia oceani TaxID=2792013 RepID=UPI001C4A638F|nr:hypothetical protein [Pseudonocardia oceani]MBW0108378.1 hypothetical protein [Pseudonocardia oceani]